MSSRVKNLSKQKSNKKSAEEAASLSVDGAKVITFYSYKGGVGRTMALANLAYLFARDYGMDVTVVDWDLEAPGLHRFFNIPDKEITLGVIDYLYRYKETLRDPNKPIDLNTLDLESFLIKAATPKGQIRLLAAGSQMDRSEYAKKVNEFDWEEFYRSWNGAQLIELLRRQLKESAEIVLIDSRTGVTDTGGICTLQLPDVVVLVFTFNEQNIAGTETMFRGISGDNPLFKQLNRRPEVLLLPSRKELSELERLRKWEREAANRLAINLTSERIKRSNSNQLTQDEALEYIRDLSLPYIPFFAYGEEIAVQTDKGIELVKPLNNLSRLLIAKNGAEKEPKILLKLSVNPERVFVGENAKWTVIIRNDGAGSLKQITATHGQTLLSQPFNLAPGEERNVSFSTSYDIPGDKSESVTVTGLASDEKQLLDSVSGTIVVGKSNTLGISDKSPGEELISRFPPVAWETLLRRIKEGRCTPFLGEGVSYPNAPLKSELSRNLAQKFSYPLMESRDLVRVAQFLAIQEDRLFAKEIIAKEFTNITNPDYSDPTNPLSVLAALPFPIYMTTYYDNFLLDTLKRQGKDPHRVLCPWNKNIRDNSLVNIPESYFPTVASPLVYYLFGHPDFPESLVLTEEDLFDFNSSLSSDPSIIPPFVRLALVENSHLYLGYGFEDLTTIFNILLSRFESSSRRQSIAISLVPDEEGIKKYIERYLDEKNVRPYWGDIKEFTTELMSRWSGFFS